MATVAEFWALSESLVGAPSDKCSKCTVAHRTPVSFVVHLCSFHNRDGVFEHFNRSRPSGRLDPVELYPITDRIAGYLMRKVPSAPFLVCTPTNALDVERVQERGGLCGSAAELAKSLQEHRQLFLVESAFRYMLDLGTLVRKVRKLTSIRVDWPRVLDTVTCDETLMSTLTSAAVLSSQGLTPATYKDPDGFGLLRDPVALEAVGIPIADMISKHYPQFLEEPNVPTTEKQHAPSRSRV